MRSIIPQACLTRLIDTPLFYPCSGDDLDEPIRLFAPSVNDFWFVDNDYFTRTSARDVAPTLMTSKEYELRSIDVTGPDRWSSSIRDIEPCVRTEFYLHRATGREVRLHRRRGYGFSALRKKVWGQGTKLGVFFYRGDSQGEGGSGNLWLIPEHLGQVLDVLVSGGLIVTDGSQHGWPGQREYEGLWRYREAKAGCTEDLLKLAAPFRDKAGRQFSCVGYAGERYGHTLAWCVEHPSP